MVQSHGIDVYVAPHNDLSKRYPQYAVPHNSPAFTGDTNEVYIEAVNGERFSIVVDLMKDFNISGGTHVYVTFSIDQKQHESALGSAESYSRLRSTRPLRSDLNGRITQADEVRRVNGVWHKCGYVFSALQMDEDFQMSPEELARDKETFGKLKVTIRRGKREGLVSPKVTKPTTYELWDGYDAPDTEVSSKKLVSDNCVSHSVRHAILEKAPQPRVRSSNAGGRVWKALDGTPGKPVEFTIRYRSRDALQKLKIIPKDKSYIDLTASPPTSPRVKHEVKDEVIKVDGPSIKHEETENSEHQGLKAIPTAQKTTVQPGTTQAPKLPEAATADVDTRASDERAKKRKQMQIELRELDIEQKRLRLMRQLAEMESEG